MPTKSRAVFIFRNKNSTIPRAFLEKAVTAYPHWCGLAFMHDGELVVDISNEPATVDGMFELMRKPKEGEKNAEGDPRPDYSACDIMFIMGKEENGKTLPDGHNNLQPFVIMQEGDGDDPLPKVISFVDGDFPSLADTDSKDGRPYVFNQQYLVPKLEALWELVDEDDAKFASNIRKKHVEKEILAAGMEGGSDSFFAAILTCAPEQGFMAYVTNPHDFPWGFTNDLCGYVEGDDDKNKKDNKNKDNKSNGGPAGKTDKVDTTSTTAWIGRPPESLRSGSNEEIRASYERFHGNPRPRNYKNLEWVSILPGQHEEARKAGWEVKPLATVEPAKANTPAAPVPASAGHGTKASVPGTSAKEKTLAFVKAIDASTLQVMTPDKIAQLEKERVTFFDQTGAKIEDTIRWTYDTNVDLVRKVTASGEDGYRMIGGYITDLTYGIHRLMQDLEEATKPKQEPAATPAKARTRVTLSAK